MLKRNKFGYTTCIIIPNNFMWDNTRGLFFISNFVKLTLAMIVNKNNFSFLLKPILDEAEYKYNFFNHDVFKFDEKSHEK